MLQRALAERQQPKVPSQCGIKEGVMNLKQITPLLSLGFLPEKQKASNRTFWDFIISFISFFTLASISLRVKNGKVLVFKYIETDQEEMTSPPTL